MIDELIKHGDHERNLTDQATEEAQNIRDAANELAAKHYESIINDYKEQARQYKARQLQEIEGKLETIHEEADNQRRKIEKTRDNLDDHAAAIVNKIQTAINDNT